MGQRELTSAGIWRKTPAPEGLPRRSCSWLFSLFSRRTGGRLGEEGRGDEGHGGAVTVPSPVALRSGVECFPRNFRDTLLEIHVLNRLEVVDVWKFLLKRSPCGQELKETGDFFGLHDVLPAAEAAYARAYTGTARCPCRPCWLFSLFSRCGGLGGVGRRGPG